MERRGTKAASSLFVAGHVVIDEIIDTPLQRVPRQELGGALCYSALCLKSLGYETEIVTRVGADFPRAYSKFLISEANVDIDEWRVNNVNSTKYRIDRSGDERRLWLASKCSDLTFNDFKRALNETSRDLPKALILNPVAGEVSLKLLESVSKEFELVFVDSQGFTRKFDEKTGEVSKKSGLDISSLVGVDALKADAGELYSWTGSKNKEDAINQLSTFVGNVIFTSGRGTVELYGKGKLRGRTKPLEVKVKDNTGAGDILLAAYAARFLETNNTLDALEFGTAASSLAVQEIGIKKAILSRSKIMKELENVKY